MSETIISTRRIYNGRIFSLDACDVRLPNGAVAYREVLHHHGAVAIIAIDPEGKVLLVRQYRVGIDGMMSELPAGILNEGEDPADCAARELQEETGYKPGKLEAMGGVHTTAGYTNEYIYLFLATELVESRLPGDEDEFIELQHFSLNDALAMIESGELTDAKTVIGLLRYTRRVA